MPGGSRLSLRESTRFNINLYPGDADNNNIYNTGLYGNGDAYPWSDVAFSTYSAVELRPSSGAVTSPVAASLEIAPDAYDFIPSTDFEYYSPPDDITQFDPSNFSSRWIGHGSGSGPAPAQSPLAPDNPGGGWDPNGNGPWWGSPAPLSLDPPQAITMHLPAAGHACEEPGCAKSFKKANDLKRHRQTVHWSGEPVYRCKCDKKSARKDNYLRHLRHCDKDGPRPQYACKCGMLCPDKHEHTTHVQGCRFGFGNVERPSRTNKVSA